MNYVTKALCVAAVSLFVAPIVQAQSMTALGTFGGGDGWRAPGEVLPGDTAGSATGGVYNYLGTANSLERGLAYNPFTGNLILVSRSTAGNGIRILSGSTGVDVGSLNQGSGIITGGTFTTNMVAAATDGSIYVANLTTNASLPASPFKVYRWTGELAAAPTEFFNNIVTGFNPAANAPRLGDSFDLAGSGVGTTLVAGAGGAGATGTLGYAVIAGGAATAVSTFTPASPANGDFRLGVTFAASANDVWGKQTSSPLRVTSYTGTTGTLANSPNLTSAGEAVIDFATIAGVPYVAALDINNSILRVYNMTNPASPLLLTAFTTTSGTLAANGNGTGSVKFGAIDNANLTATIYAMSTNQGIQAFTFSPVPEPASALLVAGAGLLTWRRLRRK